MKREFVITCLIGLVAATAALAQETNVPPPPLPPTHRPTAPMMDNLLPPPVLEDLALTPEQKTLLQLASRKTPRSGVPTTITTPKRCARKCARHATPVTRQPSRS